MPQLAADFFSGRIAPPPTATETQRCCSMNRAQSYLLFHCDYARMNRATKPQTEFRFILSTERRYSRRAATLTIMIPLGCSTRRTCCHLDCHRLSFLQWCRRPERMNQSVLASCPSSIENCFQTNYHKLTLQLWSHRRDLALFHLQPE